MFLKINVVYILINIFILCVERVIFVVLVIMNKYVNEDIILKLFIEYCYCFLILY